MVENPAEAAKTGCVCNAPGWCERHGMEKPEHLWGLCRNRQDYFDSWERKDHLTPREGVGVAVDAAGGPDGQFPCIHRGPVRRHEGCKACGQRDVTALVYWCALHGECTVHSHGLRRVGGRLEVCVACQDRREPPAGQPVVIEDRLCLGDVTVLAAACRELVRQYPGRFRLFVRTNHQYLFDGLDWVTALAEDAPNPEGAAVVPARYDAEAGLSRPDVWATINQSSQRPVHFLEAYCEGLSAALGLPVLRPKSWLEPVIRPCFGVDALLDEWPAFWSPIWLVNSGCKNDYTAKQWNGFQKVILNTNNRISWIQVGASGDNHPPLRGVALSLVGQTSGQSLVRLVHGADGILCGVTGLAHLAHWVEQRPNHPQRRAAVIIGGGRESPHWYAYPGQQVFHTIGQLSCCETGGCWRSRIVPLNDGSPNDSSLCEFPVDGVPECMRRITPSSVVEAILGTLR